MNVLPFAIVLGVAGMVGLAFYAGWERLVALFRPVVERWAANVERAQIGCSRDDLLLIELAGAAAAWSAFLVVAKPPLAAALIALPAAVAIALLAGEQWVRLRVAHRLDAFNDQLETILRLLASGMRSGLSLRQAFVLVIEELPDPARSEFRRVISQTDVGMAANDALDALARRMPSDELALMVRAVRVNSQTGGNLTKILEHLATTIKGRRRVRRKIKALTAEGVASGWVVGMLPVGVGAFIGLTQPHMRDAMLTTSAGHISLLLFCALEAIGVALVVRIVRVDV